MQKKTLSRQRPHQRGQTMIFVAISLVSLLAMAALAIDIVTLYVARSEIQRAADAAAMAAAKAIADSGVTTLQSGDPQLASAQSLAQTMATAAVNALITANPPINPVAGAAPTLVTLTPIPVDFARQGNPLVTISLKRANLPTFFSKIWGRASSSVTATATAEVYNPANLPNITPIAPKSVKPWLVANADPQQGGQKFVNPNSGVVELSVVGEPPFYLHSDCVSVLAPCSLVDNPPGIPSSSNGGHPQVDYVPAQVTPPSAPNPNVCPACEGATDYERSIECADLTTSYQVLSCGGGATSVQWDNTVSPGGPGGLSELGTKCLIHATGTGNGKGQDELDYPGWPTSPMTITAGSAPNSGKFVTTSNSIVTIPIIDTSCTPKGCFPKTGGAVTIVGYMQAFINEVHGGGNPNRRADIQVTVLNIAGCSATNNGANPIVGDSGSSPVPVRLITPP
jgi:Flp pilus assembly protein TadG